MKSIRAPVSARDERRVFIYAGLLFALTSVVAWVLFQQSAALSFAIAGVAGGVFLLGAVAAQRGASDESTVILRQLDRLPLAYVMLDEARRVIGLNERARQLLGLAAGDWSGCAWQTLLGGWTPAVRTDEMSEVGARWGVIRPDGSAAEIRYELAPLRVGRRTLHLLLLQDAGEIMSAFREESESACIRTAACLATQIAHEVRNPVAAISGSAQLLGILSEKARQGDARSMRLLMSEQDALCRSIVQESNRLDEIIARFLSFSDLSENSLRTVMELPEKKEVEASSAARRS